MAAYGDVPFIDPETGRFPDEFAPPSVASDAAAANAARTGAEDARTGAEAARTGAEAAAAGVPAAVATAVGTQVPPAVSEAVSEANIPGLAGQAVTDADVPALASAAVGNAVGEQVPPAVADAVTGAGIPALASTAVGAAVATADIPALAESAVGTQVTEQVDPEVAAAQTARAGAESARTGAEDARDETIVDVTDLGNITGAVALSQAQSQSSFIKATLTGNVTVTPAAGLSGVAYSCTLRLAQDATGGRTLTLANVATAYGVAIALSPGANQVDLVHLLWNGSSWSAMLGAAQLSIPAGWIV